MNVRNLILVLVLAVVLTACGSKTSATPLPTVALDNTAGTPLPKKPVSSSGTVAASGIVTAAQEAQMAFTLGGNVKTVNVAVGDQVTAGQVLAELDNTSIQLQVDQAQRTLQELTSVASIAAAEQALANARQDVKDTQDKVNNILYPRASDTLIKNTQGEIDLAKQALARASDAYRLVARRDDGDSQKAAALVAMTKAQLRLNDLISKYNWYTANPTDIDSAQAQANFDAAQAAVQEGQWYLDAIQGKQVPAEATGSKLAQLKQARDNLAAAQDQLAKSRLIAPFAGTVAQVDIVAGEFATPGKIAIIVSDIGHLQVETTDLSERDVPKVQVGQTVNVYVEAINQNIPGKVSLIAPTSETLGGDVVYRTTIDLEKLPEGLRAGMSAEVQYQTTP